MKNTLFLVLSGVLLIACLITAVSCGGSTPGTDTQGKPPDSGSSGTDFTPGANVEVIIEDLTFSPDVITIDTGTTVIWTNRDFVNHTVTSRTGIFDSGVITRGSSYSRTFTDAGDFEYYCTLHPDMEGRVIVK